MTYAGYVICGYALVAVALAGYARWVVGRNRSLGTSLGIGTESRPFGSGPEPGSPLAAPSASGQHPIPGPDTGS